MYQFCFVSTIHFDGSKKRGRCTGSQILKLDPNENYNFVEKIKKSKYKRKGHSVTFDE